MKRKKQGTSLIVVIILFMFVSTLSMAMLSMVLGNYKARIAESKRIENLYASDSGLDVAYNIIGKTFDAATKYAYYEVETLKLNDGSNIGPNYYKYNTIQLEINDLNSQITNLNNEIANLKKESSTDTIKEEIAQKSELIVKKKRLIEEDENMKELLLNEEFKRTFKNFIAKTSLSQLGVNESAPNKLKESIEGKVEELKKPKYVSDVNFDKVSKTFNFTEKFIEFGIKNKNDEAPKLEAIIDIPVNIPSGSVDEPVTISSEHSSEVKNLGISKSADQEYSNIIVKSSFYTEAIGTTKTNERQLQANFKMSVPNYKDIYFENTDGELPEYLTLKDRALTVYGDMKVNNAPGLTIDGEIFVEGTEPTTSIANRTYEKYNGGITISNSNNVEFNGDVVTRNSFNIRNDVGATIDGNLYGRNVYMGGKYVDDNINNGLDDFATDSSLTVENRVVVDNDLGLKAKRSTIEIKDFYGINDKTIDGKDAAGMPVDKVKTSSSIIVNANDSSTIKINESAYIMGTAHINTNETNDANRYQTGESGAVKGNYIAYSIPVPLDNTTEKFVYYDPLQLLDESDVVKKAKHFKDYWNGEISKGQGHDPDSGGIIWPSNPDGSINSNKIYSTGAIVYEQNGRKEVIGSTYYADLEKKGYPVYEMQREFATKVYKFNQSATKEYEYDKDIRTNLSDLFNFNTFNTARIEAQYDLNSQIANGEYAIFNEDPAKEIKIEKSINNNENEIDTTSDPNSIIIKISKNGILNAVIVTAGKVSITGDNITIKGCIIDNDDLIINGDGVNIKYDSGVIGRVHAQNSIIFKSVFGTSLLIDNTQSSILTADTKNSNYDLKNFLEDKSWKILK